MRDQHDKEHLADLEREGLWARRFGTEPVTYLPRHPQYRGRTKVQCFGYKVGRHVDGLRGSDHGCNRRLKGNSPGRALAMVGTDFAAPCHGQGAGRGHAVGGVPSALPNTASICTRASLGSADTPMTRRAGTPPGKKVA